MWTGLMAMNGCMAGRLSGAIGRASGRAYRNFRAQHEVKAEWEREVDRMKVIHMPDADDVIYDFRTMVERVNARLKDEFGARFLRVRGAIKVKCHHESPHFRGTRKGLNLRVSALPAGESAGWGTYARAEGAI